MASLALMTFFSCTKVDIYEDVNNPLPVTETVTEEIQGLTITPKTSYLVIGEPVTLEVAAVPEGIELSNVTWTSSDPAVATVDANGAVKTLSKGIARITAACGDQSVTAIVNVFAERVPATAIKLNKTEISMLAGRATKVKATLIPDGTGEDGAATTDQPDFTWTSSNEKVAIVSYGFIQAVGLGEATITASQNGLSATCKVSVADKIKLVDRSEAWIVTDTPKWDKNWSGQITGSHEEVKLEGFDQEFAYFTVLSADKFTDVEKLSNEIYEQVEEMKDGGQDPRRLFGTGETQTKNYSETGEAVAVVLGYDSEYEFTGEYVVYRFTARQPDPVHATGIKFLQGSWNAKEISSLELASGKNTILQLQFLPEDCTDTGTITLTAADPDMLQIDAYYPAYYSNYYRVTARGSGQTNLIATFGDVTSTLPVTVTGGTITWKNCSNTWSGSFGDIEQWGRNYFGFTLEQCSSPKHVMAMLSAEEAGNDPMNNYKAVASEYEDYLGYYASDQLPDQTYAYSGSSEDEFYVYVLGVKGDSYDGNYAIYHHVPGQKTGKMVNMKNVLFDYTWPADLATLDEVTMETWINTAGNPGKNESIIGVEGVFLLRTEDSQWQLICGGDKKANGEYNEIKLATAWTTNEWTHLAAVYSRSAGKAYLYVNGEQKATADLKDHGVDMNGVGAKWQLPFSFIIGNACDGNRYVQGSIVYTRVWKSARSASEIQDNMRKADASGSDLIASWYFTEGNGNTIADHSGNNRTLTAKKFESQMNYPETTIEWLEGIRPF